MAFNKEKVLEVNHWNETLFSFKTTRSNSFRFHNGQFVMVGVEVDNRRFMRAYSIASPNYDEHLEFFSIKMEDGPLTSRLQCLNSGDTVLISKEPVGTLVISDLTSAKNLYLLSTGTGLAPFMSVIRDPETYARFDKIILVHGVRYVSELAYQDYIQEVLPNDELLGDMVANQLIYYPTATREKLCNQGRLTDLIKTGKLCNDVGLPQLDPEVDRAMICGSPSMLNETSEILDSIGFSASQRAGDPADYVVERAFVER